MSKRHYLSPRSKIKVVEQDALLVASIEEDNNLKFPTPILWALSA